MKFLLKHVVEEKIGGRIKVTEVRGRRRKQLLDDLRRERVLALCGELAFEEAVDLSQDKHQSKDDDYYYYYYYYIIVDYTMVPALLIRSD